MNEPVCQNGTANFAPIGPTGQSWQIPEVEGDREDSGRTEPKRNVFIGLPTEMSGILGIMERHLVHYSATQNERKKHCDYDKLKLINAVRRRPTLSLWSNSFVLQPPSWLVFDAALVSLPCVLNSLFTIAVACKLFYLGLSLSRTVTSTVDWNRRFFSTTETVWLADTQLHYVIQ